MHTSSAIYNICGLYAVNTEPFTPGCPNASDVFLTEIVIQFITEQTIIFLYSILDSCLYMYLHQSLFCFYATTQRPTQGFPQRTSIHIAVSHYLVLHSISV